VRWPRLKSRFELGPFDGLSTWHLAANGAPGVQIWTLDLPPDHPARSRTEHDRSVGKIRGVTVGRHFRDTLEGSRITQLYGDSLTFDPGPLRGRMDLCFIDAGHGYEHVRRDTANALVMVRPGGTIFWHDYSRWWPGVQRCLDELSQRLPVFCVAETSLAALTVPGAEKSKKHSLTHASV
jgi:predicted O-methyltransferase YrrM